MGFSIIVEEGVALDDSTMCYKHIFTQAAPGGGYRPGFSLLPQYTQVLVRGSNLPSSWHTITSPLLFALMALSAGIGDETVFLMGMGLY